MSNILTNNINPRSGNLITIGGTNDRVSIAGTLTYEDVTNIDSFGVITARSGIKVPGGSVAIGLDTTQAPLHVKSSVARASIVESTSTDGSYTSFVDPGTSSYDRVQIGSAGNDLVLRTTEVERMRLDSTGNLGIGTDNPDTKLHVEGATPGGAGVEYFDALQLENTQTANVGAARLKFKTNRDGTAGETSIAHIPYDASGTAYLRLQSYQYQFKNQAGSSEYLRIDSSGNLGIGTDNPSRTLTVVSPSGSANILGVFDNSGGSASNCVIAFSDPTSTQGQFSTRIGCVADGLAFYTSGANRRMSITGGGSVLVGRTSNVTGGSGGNFAFVAQCFTNEENRPIAAFRRNTYNSVQIFGSNGGDGNSANCIMRVRGHSSGNRSINAGGSVNATGADYAEYMTKDGEFIIAKGDICGVTFDGKLTNNFVDAISFVVKSTDPSYIGNDVWGIDVENEEQREVARQMVDRIAFAGQVPVNVTGATPGQYIVPIQDDGGISGIAKDETDLTLIEYMRAVGKVIAIEDDGRARIIVKVA